MSGRTTTVRNRNSEGGASGGTGECGYEVDFEPELESKYKCPVCLTAMRDAVQTKCGHRFCKYCLKQSTSNTRYAKCPVDNTWFDTTKDIFGDTAIQREILSLGVLCTNNTAGCVWKGELRNLENHAKQCPEVDVDCPNRCETDGSGQVRRGALEQHLNICPQRMEMCSYCSKEITAAHMTKHQLLVCEKFPVNCGVCGETGIIREMVPIHVDLIKGNCPLVTVKCAFEYVGCHFQDKRKNMWTHYEQACHEHMLFLCSKLAEHDEKLFMQKQQLDIMSDQHHSMTILINKQEKLMEEQGELLAGQQLRLQELETCNLAAPMLWKVQLQDAQGTTITDRFDSPVMYTGRPGYKLSMSLKPSNDNSSKLTLDVHLLQGTFDNQLPFPFTGKSCITVIDQVNRKNNKTYSFNISNLPRRVLDSAESDHSQNLPFLSISELVDKKLIKDGILFLSISMKTFDAASDITQLTQDLALK